MYMSSLLPQNDMKYLSKSVLKKLSLKQKEGEFRDQSIFLEAACAWHFEDLIKMITKWIKNGFGGDKNAKNKADEVANISISCRLVVCGFWWVKY